MCHLLHELNSLPLLLLPQPLPPLSLLESLAERVVVVKVHLQVVETNICQKVNWSEETQPVRRQSLTETLELQRTCSVKLC